MFRPMGGGALVAAALALSLPFVPAPAAAQSSNPGWFVPKSAAPAAAPAPAHVRGHHVAAPPAAMPMPVQGPGPDDQAQGGAPSAPPVLPLPPVPTLTPLAKGAPPPTAVVGVISVPDIMRDSTAAQQVQKVIVGRRDKLRDDVQREQLVLRDMQQSLQDAKNLSSDQARARIRALQQRENDDKRKFQDRSRIIQEALQVALNQIERELVQVIRQVAESHGMNLVLHQEQVALNVQGFDITPQVLSQLNSVLPSVFIPAEGVDPERLAKEGTFPTTAQAQAQARGDAAKATPASAPAKPAGK